MTNRDNDNKGELENIRTVASGIYDARIRKTKKTSETNSNDGKKERNIDNVGESKKEVGATSKKTTVASDKISRVDKSDYEFAKKASSNTNAVKATGRKLTENSDKVGSADSKKNTSINKVSTKYNKKNVIKSAKDAARAPVVSTNTKALAINIALTATKNSDDSIIQPVARIMNSYKFLKIANFTANAKKNAIIVGILAAILLLFIIITAVMMIIATILDKMTFWN